jgi:hypothetical protein
MKVSMDRIHASREHMRVSMDGIYASRVWIHGGSRERFPLSRGPEARRLQRGLGGTGGRLLFDQRRQIGLIEHSDQIGHLALERHREPQNGH